MPCIRPDILILVLGHRGLSGNVLIILHSRRVIPKTDKNKISLYRLIKLRQCVDSQTCKSLAVLVCLEENMKRGTRLLDHSIFIKGCSCSKTPTTHANPLQAHPQPQP